MLQIARPLANETIESAAIALLEAESANDITGILLNTCLARAEASRGAVLLGANRSMMLARFNGGLSIAAARQAGGSTSTATATQRRSGAEIGRNDPCFCGSGKKYKKCHGANA